MMNLANKMPVTKILLFFSCIILACGSGIFIGSLWVFFKFKDLTSFIFGFLIFMASLFFAALIRMFADIGQMIFDLRLDNQRLSGQANELDQKLNQELKDHLQLQSESLNQNIQAQINILNQDLQTIIARLDKASHDSNELDQKLNQELKDHLQLQS
ncbi:MAG: hypothetical protein PHO40_00695, partial [Candidatus Omnitrophica bacterium]|nr:hypothetical protein [Candidatus Omnitrophota bacterium]